MTKRYFLYSLKNAIKPALFILIVGLLCYPLVVSIQRFDSVSDTCNVGLCVTFIAMLCYIVPIIKTAYLKKKTTVDYYYSLPIKRTTLMNINLIVGFLEIIIPFTICYFLGMGITAIRTDLFDYSYFIPLYFCLLGMSASVYIFNTFITSRANSIIDAVLLMILYTFAFFFIGYILDYCFELDLYYRNEELITFVPFIKTGNYYAEWIHKETYISSINHYWPICLVMALTYIPLFFFTKSDKSERCEQISDSYFGYRTMIPYYIGIAFAIITFECGLTELYIYPIVIMAGIIGYVIYLRKIKLPFKKAFLPLIISMVAGIIFGIVLSYFANEDWIEGILFAL